VDRSESSRSFRSFTTSFEGQLRYRGFVQFPSAQLHQAFVLFVGRLCQWHAQPDGLCQRKGNAGILCSMCR
jgi:hypothetical protein